MTTTATGTVRNVFDFGNRKEIPLTNVDFLRAVFGTEYPRAHVCAFKEDPTELDKLGLRHYWAGGSARGRLHNFSPDENQYFTISLFTPDPISGTPRRKKALHEATYCIVMDDVGTGQTAKVPWSKLKLPPSWVLETSPGNYQVGYILAFPDKRSGKISALLDALVASGLCSGGKDPGMKGVTRYVRLPEGTNTKKVYGAGGFSHRLVHWAPGALVTTEQIADAYGVRAEVDQAPDSLTTRHVSPLDPGEDFVLDVLFRGGLVKQELSAGVWDIECPFIDGHTQRADSGSAYLSPGGFACHHGHCADRTSGEFLDKLARDYPTEWAAARRDQALRDFSRGNPFAGLDMPGLAEQKAQTAAKLVSGRFSGAFGYGDVRGSGKAQVRANWLLKNLFPEQGMGVLFGAPKTGKSFVAMDLALRVGLGMDWHGHAVKRDGLVLYVSSEGGQSSAWNRVLAWHKKHGVSGSGSGSGSAGDVLVWPGSLRLGSGLVEDAEALVAYCRGLVEARGKELSLLVIDTLNRNMVGDENSTEDMTGFVQTCDWIWRELGCFLLFVHHSGKDASRGLRGSSVLLGSVDAEIELKRDKDVPLTEPGEIVLSNLRHAEDGKRYGFVLEYVQLGVDEDLEAVGSLVPVDSRPPVRAVRLGPVEREIRDVVLSVPGLTLDGICGELPDRRRDNIRRGLERLTEKEVVQEIENAETKQLGYYLV